MTPREAWRSRVADIGELVVWLNAMRTPTLGNTRLVCVDGGAGAGKSTLAGAVLDAAVEIGTARLVHTDDLLAGWGGLDGLSTTVGEDLLAPLAQGRRGSYRRFDWHRGEFAERHVVDPVDTLVLEGVGSWASAYAGTVTTLVWVEAPRELRLRRGLERDGAAMEQQWLAWLDAEDRLFLGEGTREYADMTVDGTGTSDQSVVLA